MIMHRAIAYGLIFVYILRLFLLPAQAQRSLKNSAPQCQNYLQNSRYILTKT